MNKRKFVIVQNTIPHYRIPLFQRIADDYDLDVSVVHSDAGIADKVFPFQTIYLPSRVLFGFTFQPGLLKILDNADTIISMFDLRWATIMRGILRKDLASKTYLWTHGYGRISLFNKLRAHLAKRSKGLVLYYKEFAIPYIEEGLSKEKIYESSNTILVKNSAYNPSITRDRFVYVGRLQERKQIDVLISVFARILPDYPSVKLDVIGGGFLMESIRQLASELDVSKSVTFHGECTDEQVLKHHFQRSLAYVSPGHVGLGVLHAFAYGCPVVTSATAYHAPEFVNCIDEVNSLLFNDEKNIGLELTLRRLLEEKGLSERLGKEAYQIYRQKRTIDIMASNLANLK